MDETTRAEQERDEQREAERREAWKNTTVSDELRRSHGSGVR